MLNQQNLAIDGMCKGGGVSDCHSESAGLVTRQMIEVPLTVIGNTGRGTAWDGNR